MPRRRERRHRLASARAARSEAAGVVGEEAGRVVGLPHLLQARRAALEQAVAVRHFAQALSALDADPAAAVDGWREPVSAYLRTLPAPS